MSAENVLTRRNLLTAAVASLVAGVASALGRPFPVEASNGNPVLLGKSNSATGTTTVSTGTGYGISARSTGFAGRGLNGKATRTTGATYGVYGTAASTAGRGVAGVATATSGSAHGVYGSTTAPSGSGVFGVNTATSGAGPAVRGESLASANGQGVQGKGTYTGVSGYALATAGLTYGVYGQNLNYGGYALYGYGNGKVTGGFTKAGGSFQIDHPLDPANKYLRHSFVESPDMLNVYAGNVTLDEHGEASVAMPDWFEVLNRDVRYQLTAVGAPAPNLHVKSTLAGGCFAIGGGMASQVVSWQITGIRQDAWANAHRIPVEELKSPDEQGRYLHPVEAGQPLSAGIPHPASAG